MTGPADLFRALGTLSEPPHPAHRSVAAALDLRAAPPTRAQYLDVFGMQLVPYASVYVGPEGMLGGLAADRIAGFWRSLGYLPPPEPDHLAALLGLYATVSESETDEDSPARRLLLGSARQALLWEHLLTWLPAYTAAVVSTGDAFYADWAALLVEALAAEAARADPPELSPAHLRSVPPLPHPDDEADGVQQFVRAVLTPVRSGVILTRRDLARCARDHSLGMRVGERPFLLRSLLEQDPLAVLAWLDDQAQRWAAQHRAQTTLLGVTATHWARRAESTSTAALERRQRLQEVLTHASHG